MSYLNCANRIADDIRSTRYDLAELREKYKAELYEGCGRILEEADAYDNINTPLGDITTATFWDYHRAGYVLFRLADYEPEDVKRFLEAIAKDWEEGHD